MSSRQQQVSVDLVNMVFTACTYLALAGAAWVFLRLLQACFWLPRHLKKQNDVQQMLQDKVDSYEKYVQECEEKEKSLEGKEDTEKCEKSAEVNADDPTTVERWKERRECLEMLKRELKRVRDGGDPYDWDHLLDDTDDEEKKEETTEDNVKYDEVKNDEIKNNEEKNIEDLKPHVENICPQEKKEN